MRYRLTVFDEPRGVWRATRAEVMADAIELDLASWDDVAGEWFLAVPVGHERDAGDPPALARVAERLAEAAAVKQRWGERAKTHVVDRVLELRKAGNLAGVRRWAEIGAAIVEMERRKQ